MFRARPAGAPMGDNAAMPTDAEGARVMARAARRREAVQLLRVAASMADYAARQAGNGLAPEDARLVVAEAAAELAAASARLMHLARLDPEERRQMARLWVGAGMPVVEVARRLGCAERSVHRWLGSP